jgi:hypothetical protein
MTRTFFSSFSESNNQRLLLGDSGPIPIIGTGKQGAAGQKNRQDLKKYSNAPFNLRISFKRLFWQGRTSQFPGISQNQTDLRTFEGKRRFGCHEPNIHL